MGNGRAQPLLLVLAGVAAAAAWGAALVAGPWGAAAVVLLAMAVQGEADYLVTGDKRAGLLQRGHIERTRIVIPAVFCEEVL